MLNNLPFLQDPEQFLLSYFWGCNQGHSLSLLCKQQLAGNQVKGDAGFPEQLMEAALDCYVHAKSCTRCEPIEKVTCQRGYEIIQERDATFDEAQRLGVKDRGLEDQDDSLSHEQLHAVFNKEFVQRQFRLHRSSCRECSQRQPRGRYSFAVWNIEGARSQRL